MPVPGQTSKIKDKAKHVEGNIIAFPDAGSNPASSTKQEIFDFIAFVRIPIFLRDHRYSEEFESRARDRKSNSLPFLHLNIQTKNSEEFEF